MRVFAGDASGVWAFASARWRGASSVEEARARCEQRVCTRCADPCRPLRGCAQVIETDLEWRQSQFKVDNLRADYGKLNKEVAAKKKAKKKEN